MTHKKLMVRQLLEEDEKAYYAPIIFKKANVTSTFFLDEKTLGCLDIAVLFAFSKYIAAVWGCLDDDFLIEDDTCKFFRELITKIRNARDTFKYGNPIIQILAEIKLTEREAFALKMHLNNAAILRLGSFAFSESESIANKEIEETVEFITKLDHKLSEPFNLPFRE
jgi:hypothetical protein